MPVRRRARADRTAGHGEPGHAAGAGIALGSTGDRRGCPCSPSARCSFPGLVLPLHIFEERYRDAGPPPGGAARRARRASSAWWRSGSGWEVAARGRAGGPTPAERAVTLHEVGCTAELRQVTELPDGRFDIVTVGRRRFRIADVSPSAEPYLTADVEWLPEPAGRRGAGRPARAAGAGGVPAVPRR